MDLDLTKKVILVTGGASGIGQAIARAAAHEGASVMIVDRSSDRTRQLAAELAHESSAACFIADLCSTENCARAVCETIEMFGRIDALVNNAGINDRVGLEQGSSRDFVASLQRNLLHYYDLAHFALPELKKSCGSILNIASKVAVTGQGGTSGYVASKGAILALTREWAVELLPYQIRVNAIVPAEVMTPLYRSWLDTFPNPDEKLASITSRIPLGQRMTEPEEIATMALFLISPRASHITGQHVFVDGGYTHLDRAIL